MSPNSLDLPLDSTPDAIVVGGGLYGASILYWLARRGADAVLLERSHLASGPTGLSSAIIRQQYSIPELADLARFGLEFMRNFEDRTGYVNDFTPLPTIYGVGADLAKGFEANVSQLAARGFEIELLTPDELELAVPGFDLDGIVVGVREPMTGYADPVATTNGFASAAVGLGGTVRTNCEVVQILVDDGRCIGVELSNGSRLMARRVIVAAGPWSKMLASQVGIALPIFAERQVVAIVATAGNPRELVPCTWFDKLHWFYARPDGPGSIVVGGTTSGTAPVADPDQYADRPGLSESGELIERASRRIPLLASQGIRQGYASLYDMSVDRLPIVGSTPIPGLFVCVGTCGMGFKFAAAIGKEFVRLALDGESELLRPFALDRSFGAMAEFDRGRRETA